jgi:hypothetical protein
VFNDRNELRGTLSPDGRTVEKLVLTTRVRGSRKTWTTVRDIPGEPSVEPTLEKEKSWRIDQRVVLRNLVLRGGKGSSSFSLFLDGAAIQKLVVSASSSASDMTKVHAGWESDQQSSYSLVGLDFPGNESKAKLVLSFGSTR